LLAGALISGCCAIGLGDCSYDLDICMTGNVTEQLKSVFIIVADKNDVSEPLADESRYGELVSDERLISKYRLMSQYKPVEHTHATKGTTELTWELVDRSNRREPYVEIEIDGDVLQVSVDHKLVDPDGPTPFCLVVLANYAANGFQKYVVEQTTLANKLDESIEVDTVGLRPR
jgi:hypothetical protein